MEKKSNEIRTKHNKLHVGNRAELKGCPVAKVTHKKKDDYKDGNNLFSGWKHSE